MNKMAFSLGDRTLVHDSKSKKIKFKKTDKIKVKIQSYMCDSCKEDFYVPVPRRTTNYCPHCGERNSLVKGEDLYLIVYAEEKAALFKLIGDLQDRLDMDKVLAQSNATLLGLLLDENKGI